MTDPEIYVIVAENDQPGRNCDGEFTDPDGPIVLEQYVQRASFRECADQIDKLNGKFGECRIARLVFINDERGEK